MRMAASASEAANQAMATPLLPASNALSAWPGQVVGSQSMCWANPVRPERSGRPFWPNVCLMLRFHARYSPAPVRPATAAATSRAILAGTHRRMRLIRIACSDVIVRISIAIRTTASGKYTDGAPAPTPTPRTAATRMPLIRRLALMALTSRAMNMSRVRTGATMSCKRSRPTKKDAITVGKPTPSTRESVRPSPRS